MSWFNTYPSRDGDALTRTGVITENAVRIVTKDDLSKLPLGEWTLDELGLRLAVLYPQVDGYGHQTAPEEVITEVEDLMREIRSRGYDPVSNLQYNERFQGWGWLNWFDELKGES